MGIQKHALFSSAATAAMLCALDGAATAADMPVKAAAPVAQPVIAVPSWTGFYIGGHLGYAWGKLQGDESGDTMENGGRVDPKGWLAGVHGGYNWQYTNWVFGVEGNWSGVFNSEKKSCAVSACDSYIRGELNSLASIRGRLGWAFNNNQTLLFGTVGGGWRRYTLLQQSGSGDKPFHKSVSGVVWGGGIEHKLTQNVSVRLQALRYQGSQKLGWGSDSGDGHVNIGAVTTVDAGLTWHF